MKVGLEGDKRKFQKPYLYDVTKDIPREVTKWPKCVVCGLEIKGSKYRIAEGKYLDFQCWNEGNPPRGQGDFYNDDFYYGDFY